MALSANYRVAYEDDPVAEAIRDFVATNPTPAQLAEVEKAAEVLLSNPVIENYVVRVEK